MRHNDQARLGLVHQGDTVVAAYFVTWAEQRSDHGASLDLILGKWGESATSGDRFTIALDYKVVEAFPQFMVVDAQGRPASGSQLAGSALKRSEVIGTPLAPQVFALVDAIYMGDTRLDELRRWHQ